MTVMYITKKDKAKHIMLVSKYRSFLKLAWFKLPRFLGWELKRSKNEKPYLT